MAEKGKFNFHENYLKKEWSYNTGATLLALLAIALAVFTGSSWGVTGVLSTWGGKFLILIGINADAWPAFNGSLAKYKFWESMPSMTNIGIIFGALIATLLAAQFKLKKIKSWKNVVAAVIGGTLMGIGARFADGCNIGALFTAVPAFSLHGWLFLVSIFAGAAVGSKLLKKFFM